MLEYIFPRHSITNSFINPLSDDVTTEGCICVSGGGDRGVDRMSSPLGIHGLGMETDTKNTANCRKSSVYWPEGVKAQTKKK